MSGFNSKRDAAADKLQEPVNIASIIACREMLDAQPVPARVQYMTEDDDDIQGYKRPWVGLTGEEWLSLGCKSVEEVRIGLAIQAKLKEKNS